MEYDDIEEQFNKVITYSQNIENPQTKDIFQRWQVAKSRFIHAFGDKLIYEWPEEVCFELNEKDKNARIENFIELLNNKYHNEKLAQFIYDNKDGFFSNKVKNSSYENIPAGMKLLKAFKFFEDDSKKLSEIQMAASMIIQEDKIKGRLCLSVHPLDYLSISENNHNWRSCHALDGDYRAGNLSYMIDTSTIICYLKSQQDEIIPNFPDDVPWNSKKWRVLLFIGDPYPNVIFAGRQYPFSTQYGMDFVKNNLFDAVGFDEGYIMADWTADKMTEYKGNPLYSSYIYCFGRMHDLNELVRNQKFSLNYNDLLCSTCYDPIFTYQTDQKKTGYNNDINYFIPGPMPKFNIGGAVKCLKCGQKQMELSETMMCIDCELKYGTSVNDMFDICQCCEERFFTDDGYFVHNLEENSSYLELLCADCAKNFTDVCDGCGERFYVTDLYTVSGVPGHFCKSCRTEYYPEEDKE